MPSAHPLPSDLVEKYRTWKAGHHTPRQAYFQELVDLGQHPRQMIVSCCDSRVHVTQMFGADTGEMFIHRNVAALVPPSESSGGHHGTSAALEYAVRVLKIGHLIVLGHSNCGGVQGCFEMCEGRAPELEKRGSFIGGWMDLLKPGYDRLPREADIATKLMLLEKEAVLVSLENMMTFRWIAEAVEGGQLQLHGLWTDIARGALEIYLPERGGFVPV